MSVRIAASFALYVLAVGLAVYSWAPLIHAKWGLIDDHEIMAFVGEQERMPLAKFPAVLLGTELSTASISARFRPSYYVLRAVEAAVWGKNAALWYAFRIGIALLMSVVLAHICLQFAGPILTSGFLVFALSAGYWADIFAKAGSGETYAVLGVCLVALGLGLGSKNVKEIGSSRALLISTGIAIAAGSKENFLVLGGVPLWLLFSRAPRTTPGGKVLFISVLGFLAWIGFTLLGRLRAAGTDIYANDISFSSRFRLLESFFSIPAVPYWLTGLFLLMVAAALLKVRARRNETVLAAVAATSMGSYLAMGCGLFAVYAAQFIFYNGKWPGSVSRYQFPGILAFHFSILIGLVAVTRLIELSWPGRRKLVALIQLVPALWLVIASVGIISDNRRISLETVRATSEFDAKLQVVAGYLGRNPEKPLIINTFSVSDYEPVFSMERFVRARGLANPVAIRMNGYAPAQYRPDSLEGILSTALARISEVGSGDLFVSLSNASQIDCFSVGMSGPFLQTCAGGGVNVWPQ